MAEKKVFRRIKGRVVLIKGRKKSHSVKDDMRGVSTKKLIEASKNYGRLQHANKKGLNVSEYAPEALKGEINKRMEAKAEKMFSHKGMMEGLEAHYKAKANKRKAPRSKHVKGGFSFYYGKRAHQKFKKNNKGSWVTAKGAKIYFIKNQGKVKLTEEIPF